MATSLTLQNDSSLAQGYIKVNGTTAATLTTSGITANLTGNVTGNADTATKFSTTTGSAPAYACRAWVNFDGTRDTTGAVSTANTNRLIRASGNVTSVLRNGTGDYTVNFTTAMADANYSISGFCGTANNTAIRLTILRSQSSSSFAIGTINNAFNPVDENIVLTQVFGN